MSDDVLTRDNDGNLAVRTVSSTGDNYVNPDDVYTRDSEGKLCVRTTGEGGGGSVDYNRVVEKIAVIPSAETATVGKVYMYMGESNATYTHGYIYECVSTQTATAVSFSGNIISSWAVADFVSYLQEGGAAYNEITHGTLTYDATGNLWDLVGYDANGIQVMSFHEYTEDLEDFGCTFASATHQDGDNCTFTLTTEESGKKWKRLDVQPASQGGGAVESVNGKTGAVIINASDVGGVPQYSTMPTASADNVGNIVQYIGSNGIYTNGFFYKCTSDGETPATYYWELVDVQPSRGIVDVEVNGASVVQGDTAVITCATIDDTSTSSLTATWSASKLNTTIGNIESLLAAI